MNFRNLNSFWELKRLCISLYRTDFYIFFLSEFYFQYEFLFNFDFQMHKTHLKSFVIEILFFGDYSSIDLLAL